DIGLPFGLPRWKWRFVSKTVFPDYIVCKSFSLVPKLLNNSFLWFCFLVESKFGVIKSKINERNKVRNEGRIRASKQ
ncbi:hypothetical protein, partial [Bacillus paramycoides]